jgi:uncharacterized membrane protein HdeD (DUF308 family)
MPTLIQNAAKTMRFLGLALVVLGLLCAFVPRGVGLTIGVLVGVLLVIAGLLRVTFAWVAASWGSALLRFAFGVLAIIAGGYLVAQPDLAPRLITVAAAVYLILDGISGIIFALRLPPAAGGASVILGAIVSLALGVMIWRDWPMPGGQMLGIAIGAKLVVDGVVMLVIAQGARRIDEALAQGTRAET